VLVFGRIAGRNAAIYARERAKVGRLTLDHIRSYHRELEGEEIEADRISPMLLPDYSNPVVRKRQLTTRYVGTLR
jgi:succinate dehydrogenase/fumarate reductase flavoprotein subunit